MSTLLSSGKIGTFSYFIYPNETAGPKHLREYTATVKTPSEVYEVKVYGCEAAKRWVERTISKLKEKAYDNYGND